MSKLNDYATELFKKLIDNGYKYLIKCSNYSLTYKIGETKVQITASNNEYEESDPLKFKKMQQAFGTLSTDYFCTTPISISNKNDNTLFAITVNDTRVYDVNITSRLDIALYLDKIDNILIKWEEDQLRDCIHMIDAPVFIPSGDFE